MNKKCHFWLPALSLSLLLTAAPAAAADDQIYFLPEKDGVIQPFVGDCMPYYEDGVYYIYYLKEGGDSYRHSIYLTTTTDFLTYTEYDDPILVSEDGPAQDEWIGTGSVVKVDDTYYLFYTGHTDSDAFEYGETIMLAKGTDLYSFEKVSGWEITPDDSLNQKRDFRDPQGYFDEETGCFHFTVTASQDGVARILKYTVSKDLSEITYDGIIFTDPIGKVYNLECSDTFRIGDTWYLTYSAQDDVLWYASSTDPYGPYSEPCPLDGPLFYAAKHVEDGTNAYMAGWARRSGSERDTRKVNEWAGNLVVQQISQLPDGSLVLKPVDAIENLYQEAAPIIPENTSLDLSSDGEIVFSELCTTPAEFRLTGDFCFEEDGCFGLAFDFYCHFTSPIRRYPDLQIHRIIKDHLRGRMTEAKAHHYNEILDEVAKHSSETERRAEEAERETDKLKKAQYMENHLGERFEGVISGVTAWGLFVELENSCEGMIRAASMEDDFYVYDENNMKLVGERYHKEYNLGQKVWIKVVGADRLTKAIDFKIIDPDAEDDGDDFVEYSEARKAAEFRASKVRKLMGIAQEAAEEDDEDDGYDYDHESGEHSETPRKKSESKKSRKKVNVRGEMVDLRDVEPDPRTGKPKLKKPAGRKVYKVHKYKKSATSKAARSSQGKGRKKKR